MEYFHWYINSNEKRVSKYKILTSELTFQILNATCPSRKLSIKETTKFKTSFDILMDMYLQ